MWKSLCKRLWIIISLFTAYHSEINDQTEWVNQDVERELRIYCNYMQNDWAKWISMIEFNDNVNTFSIISIISFYFNKEFHSQMSFDSDTTDYKITHEWIKARKANDIIIWMKELEVCSARCTFQSRVHFTLLLSSFFKNQLQIQYDFNWSSFCRSSFARLI